MNKLLQTLIVTAVLFSSQALAQTKPVLSYRLDGTSLALSWTPTTDAIEYKLYYANLPYAGPHTINELRLNKSTKIEGVLPVGSHVAAAIVSVTDNQRESWSNIIEINIADPTSKINTETSYENAKGKNYHSLEFPIIGWEIHSSVVNAYAFDDFRNTGNADLFTTSLRYNNGRGFYSESVTYSEELGHNIPASESVSSLLTFWKQTNNGWEKTAELIGCLHPRKTLSADFNNDGFTDLFIACIGWDGDPPDDVKLWSGETSFFLRNNGDSTFTRINIGKNSYLHGASAGDINNDGLIDIAVADVHEDGNNRGVYFLINKGNFNFEKNTTIITPESVNNLTIELIDVDSDGTLELLTGPGQEGINQFTLVYKLVDDEYVMWKQIPSVQSRGAPLDFVYKKELCEQCIYVLRTSDFTSESYYDAITVQRYNIETGQSDILYDRFSTSGGKSLFLIVPVETGSSWSIRPYTKTFTHVPSGPLPVNDYGK
jgi:hypothetical protein